MKVLPLFFPPEAEARGDSGRAGTEKSFFFRARRFAACLLVLLAIALGAPPQTAHTQTAVTLVESMVGDTSATLTLSGHVGGWSYTRVPSGTGLCIATSQSAVSLIGLTPSTLYTYRASLGNACSTLSREVLATVTFATTPHVTAALSGPASITSRDTFTVTATFGESVTGLALSDVTASSRATVSNLQGSGTAWTVDVTPFNQNPITVTLAFGAAMSSSGDPTDIASLTVTYAPSGVTVSKDAVEVFETGGEGTYTVVLDTEPNLRPGESATLTPTSDDTAAAVVSTARTDNTLVFTADDWDTPQTVTVTGVKDGADNAGGSRTATVTHAVRVPRGSYNQLTAAAPVTVTVNDVTATASLVTQTGATLTVTNHPSPWYYERTTPGGGTCTAVSSGATAALSDLTAGTSYTYKTYSDNTCTNANELAEETFMTLADDTSAVTAGSVTTTGATLTVANHPSTWYHKRTSPSGGTCSSAQTSTTADLTGLTPGADYTWNTYSDATCTDANEVAEVMFTTPPGQVMNITVRPAKESLGMTWDEVTGATGYEVQWKTGSETFSSGETPARHAMVTEESYTITGLTGGEEYTVRVRASNAGGDGAWSGEGTARASSLDKVTGVMVAASSAGAALDVSWTAVAGAAKYVVSWTSDGNFDSASAGTETVTAPAVSYTIPGLTAGTEYSVMVQALDASDRVGVRSDVVKGTPTALAVTLAAGGVKQSSATLTITGHAEAWWHTVSMPTSESRSCDSVAADTASAEVTDLTPGVEYVWKAYSDSGCAAELATVRFSTPKASVGDPVGHTGTTLTVANHPSTWYHKRTAPTTPTASCSTAQTSATVDLTGLTPGTDYTWNTYSDSTCTAANELASVEFTTNTAATGAPAITGTAQVGTALTATSGDIADTDGLTNPTYSYQWIRVDVSSETDIPNATNSTYTPVAGDVGKKLKVRASFDDDLNNPEMRTSAATATVTVVATTLVSNIGQSTFSSTLDLAAVVDYAQSFTTGGNAAGYDLQSIQVQVAAAANVDGVTAKIHSVSSGDPGSVFRTLANPTPSSTGAQTLAFTAPAGTVLVTGTTYFVVLECSGPEVCIKLRQTSSDSEDGGRASGWSIVDTLHFHGGGQWGTRTNALKIGVRGSAKAGANNAAAGAPTITGTAQVGSRLSADTSGITDADGLTNATYSYQWILVDVSSETDIANATNSTYTPVAGDVGKKLKVRVSFTDNGGSRETLTSVATAAVTAAPEITVTIAAGTSPVTEGTAAQFTVTATPAPLVDLVVGLDVAEAEGLGDFVASGGEGEKTVRISAGSASATYSVPTVADDVDEPDGGVTVTVGAGTDYTAGTADSATVTVNDNDAEPVVSVTTPSVAEGDTGTAALDFEVTLDRKSAYAYRCSTLDGDSKTTATASTDTETGDYEPKDDDTLSFAASETLTFSVTVNGDTVSESHEKIAVRCRRGDLTGATALGTITDDEPIEASVAAGTSPVSEGTAADFTVTLTRSPAAELSVKLTVADVSGSDFVASGDEGEKTVRISAGGTSATHSVPTVDDGTAETSGEVTVTLATGSGYAVASSPGNTASVRVNDDDANVPPAIGGTATDFSVAENTPVATAVATFTADDPDTRDSVTGWTLAGADKDAFSITSGGKLTFKAVPDHERPVDVSSASPSNTAGNNEYIVAVIVRSGAGLRSLSASRTLTVTVTDVVELPGKPAAPTVGSKTGHPDTLTVSWVAPANTGPDIDHYDLQYRKTGATDWMDGPADVESPEDITGLESGVTYEVEVRATSAEGDSPWSDSGSGATESNAPPQASAAPSLMPSVAENTPIATAVATVTATDGDTQDTARKYTLGGADADAFAIDEGTGELTFKAAPNHESPTDVMSTAPQDGAMNNVYIVTVEVASGAGERELAAAPLNLTVTVTDVDEPPGVPAAPTVSGSTLDSLTVTWTEPGDGGGPPITGYGVQYKQESSSGAFIPWTRTGSGLEETITGLTPDTNYQVQVRATNEEESSEWSASVTHTTMPDRPPVLTVSDTTPSVDENETAVATVISANDPDEGDGVSNWRLGGADASRFELSSSQELTFRDAPNHESATDVLSTSPANAAENNEYIVTVMVDGGSGGRAITVSETLTVTVDDVDEPPGVPVPVLSGSTLNSLTITWAEPANEGPPITGYDVRYRQERPGGGFSGAFTPWPRTESGLEETITGLTPNTNYQVRVQATNAEGPSGVSVSVTGRTVADTAPTLNVTPSATPSVAENTPVATAVATFAANDPDAGDEVTGWSVSGTDSDAFNIDEDTGALTFKTVPNYESPTDAEGDNEYIVTVTVSSGVDGVRTLSASSELTVTVTDDDTEAPDAPAPTVSKIRPKTLTITWAEPANEGPPIDAVTGYDVRYRQGSSGGFTDWSRTGSGLEETITGLEQNTNYEVQVQARNAEGLSGFSASAAATTGGFQITVVSGVGSLAVDWPAIQDAAHYRVRWKTSSAADFTPANSVDLLAGSTSHPITGLTANVEYTVEVSAREAGSPADFSIPSAQAEGTGTPTAPPIVPNNPAAGEPSITGEPRVGETLEADTTGISDADGLERVTYTYQWLRVEDGSPVNISGETGFQYVAQAGDACGTLAVRVNFIDDAGNPETLTGMPTAVVRGTRGATVSPAVLTVNENGGTATFTVVLDSDPCVSVTAVPSASDPTAATTGSAGLTFTSSDWDVPQTVTVTGVDDDVVNPGGERETAVQLAYSSADEYYDGHVEANLVRVTVTDDEDGDGDGETGPPATSNGAPAFSSEAQNQVAYAGEEFTYVAPAAADPDDDAIEYTAALADGGALPGWLSFDDDARTFSGTPGEGDAPADLSIEITATDDGAPPLSATTAFTLRVEMERCGVSEVRAGDQSLMEFVECAARRVAAADTFGKTLALLERFRDPEGNWNDGTTYLVMLTEEGGVYFHAADREAEDLNWSGLVDCEEGSSVPDELESQEGCLIDGGGYAHRFAASHVPLAGEGEEFVLLGGFEEIPEVEPLTGDIGEPSVEAEEVDSDEELRDFVEDAKTSLEMAIEGDTDPALLRAALRDGEGPWKAERVYVYIMNKTGRVIFHGGDREREQTDESANPHVTELIGNAGQEIVLYSEDGYCLRGYLARVEIEVPDEENLVYFVGSGYQVEAEQCEGEGGCAVGGSSGRSVSLLFLAALALLLVLPLKRRPPENRTHSGGTK